MISELNIFNKEKTSSRPLYAMKLEAPLFLLVQKIKEFTRSIFHCFFCSYSANFDQSQLFEKTMTAITILGFYQGERNDRNVTLEEIWNWSDTILEQKHDFIQWLFPLPTKSHFNPTVPVTTKETILAFKKDPNLRIKMKKSFQRMLRFYGLEQEQNGKIKLSKNFAKQAKNWLNLGNHNYLRLSRILTSLTLHGLKSDAKELLEILKTIYKKYPEKIEKTTYNHWASAISSV